MFNSGVSDVWKIEIGNTEFNWCCHSFDFVVLLKSHTAWTDATGLYSSQWTKGDHQGNHWKKATGNSFVW